MCLVSAVLSAFATSIGISKELLYVVDCQHNLQIEQKLEMNLILAGENPTFRAESLQPGQVPLSGNDRGHEHGVVRDDNVCVQDPGCHPSVSNVLALDDESANETERFPGSHPLSLEALVKRAHGGLGHPGRKRFLRILTNSKASQRVIEIAKKMKCSPSKA